MGFDLYGLNPKIRLKHTDEYYAILEKYGKDGWLDWKKDIPEATKERYFELKDQYQEDNPGDYFRNNVWFWRPLWNFVCGACEDILTIEDMNAGGTNSGDRISEKKAVKIGKRLSELLADGTVDEIHRKHELQRLEAEAHNKEVKAEMDKVSEACKKEHGEDLVPANYPEPYKSEWNELHAKEKFSAHYPFDRGNIENFAKFCLDSGGFEIC